MVLAYSPLMVTAAEPYALRAAPLLLSLNYCGIAHWLRSEGL